MYLLNVTTSFRKYVITWKSQWPCRKIGATQFGAYERTNHERTYWPAIYRLLTNLSLSTQVPNVCGSFHLLNPPHADDHKSAISTYFKYHLKLGPKITCQNTKSISLQSEPTDWLLTRSTQSRHTNLTLIQSSLIIFFLTTTNNRTFFI